MKTTIKREELLDATRAALVGKLFEYVRVGYDSRRIIFAADGTLGRGRARCETYWRIRLRNTRLVLDLCDDGRELTCRLRPLRDGSWRGRWTRFEKMPVRLVPVLADSRPRTLLLQQADGDFRAMLNLTYSRHAEYARRHGMDFWCIHGEPQAERDCVWNKILLIRQALACQYQLIVWLDADTFIARLDQDLRVALREFSCIGMCRHPLPWDCQPWHYNAGVIFVRNCELAREFFRRVWVAGPSPHPWQEQARIMECAAEFPRAVQPISDDWNSTEGITPRKNPIIRAWHGIGNAARRCALMRAELAALEETSRHPPSRAPAAAGSTSRRNLRNKRPGLRKRLVQL